MSEEGKTPDATVEDGLRHSLNTTTPSMTTSQRKRAALASEHECECECESESERGNNGHLNGHLNGHILPPHPSNHQEKKKKATTKKHQSTPPTLITYTTLPPWYRDNPHIHTGYRPESHSTHSCLLSLLYLHNETLNIYTHLIPALIFLLAQAFLLHQLHQRFPLATPLDYIVFSFFLLSATVALGLSSLYHTLMNHSKAISHLWLRLDYVGILVLILGFFVSGIRMGFYCDAVLQRVYWVMTLTLSLLTSILVIHPKYFQGLQYRALRVTAFVTLGLSGCVPIGHGLVISGWTHMWRASGMPYYFLEGVILVLGAFFYATRCPESIRPGRFDFYGCSHNIFHVLVVAATVVHLVGIWNAFAFNYRHVSCAA